MEFKKEDLAMFIDLDGKKFYAFPREFFKKEEIPESVEEVDVELELQKEKDAKLIEEMKIEKEKADKKAALLAELAKLEE